MKSDKHRSSQSVDGRALLSSVFIIQFPVFIGVLLKPVMHGDEQG